MKDFSYYSDVEMSYPNKTEIKEQIYKENNFDKFVGTKAQIAEEEKRLKELINKYYVELQTVYLKEKDKKFMEFKKDSFEELGIENNPKRDKLFEIAWEKGHSYGYSNVYSNMVELLPLIED